MRKIVYNRRALEKAPAFRRVDGSIVQGKLTERHCHPFLSEIEEVTCGNRADIERVRQVVTEDELIGFIKVASGEIPLSKIGDCLGIDRANVMRLRDSWLRKVGTALVALIAAEAVRRRIGTIIDPRRGEELRAAPTNRWEVTEPKSEKQLATGDASEELLVYVRKHEKVLFESDDSYLRVTRDPESGDWWVDILHLMDLRCAVERIRHAADAVEKACARRRSACTINPRTGEAPRAPTRECWVVYEPGRRRSLVRKPTRPQFLQFISDHEDAFFGADETYFSLTYDPRTRRWHLDVTRLLSLDAARACAAVHRQNQIVNACTGEGCAIPLSQSE